MKIDILKRQIGLNFDENNYAEIWLWAPNASLVSIEFGLQSAELILNKNTRGYWYLKTKAIKAGDCYRFKITPADETQPPQNGGKPILRADPASVLLEVGSNPDGIAFDLKDFKWTDEAWIAPNLDNLIIYELHVGTFTQAGDFAGIETKLDYLISLGITAIEIMPVSQFSGERNWGYDGVYPFAVQNSYGGPQALQQLVNLCHKKGLAVILDVVYNHMGPEGNYLKDFGNYFTKKYTTPWGEAINFDDAFSDEVRLFFIENALMWFRDFHVDALRLDAVHAIKDFSPLHILQEIKQHVDLLSTSLNKTFLLIAETDLNDPKIINPINKNGYGMDAQWMDEFHHALRVASHQAQTGYYADLNGVADLAKSYRDAYVYDGQYSAHRNKTFGAKALGNPGNQFIVFSQNHDQIGNRMLGERTAELVSFEMLKLLAGAVFCSPFIPLIFMGEEYGETNPFLFFTSHYSESLAEQVREGRKAEFAAFHSGGDVPDPQDTTSFTNSKLDWDKLNRDKHTALLNYYKALILLRKSNPALAILSRENTQAFAFEEKQVVVIKRSHQSLELTCILNFSSQHQTIELSPAHNLKLIFNSADPVWNGSTTYPNHHFNQAAFAVSAESLLILSNN